MQKILPGQTVVFWRKTATLYKNHKRRSSHTLDDQNEILVERWRVISVRGAAAIRSSVVVLNVGELDLGAVTFTSYSISGRTWAYASPRHARCWTVAPQTTYKLYKKLSYRRESACQRSVRRSRSFNATDFATDRKPVCDFLL